MHLDSLFCYSAFHAGIREELLPDSYRIYHVEHAIGSGWTPEGGAQLYARLAAKGVPAVSDSEAAAWISAMRRLNCPLIFNHNDWGLDGKELPEKRFSARRQWRPFLERHDGA
jgi:hypothetical protein